MAKYKHLTMSENRNIFSVERRQKHSQDSESVNRDPATIAKAVI
ncbi:hypothetical protein [Roseburia inulinivorans]|nr:hypothetical protein [Roseburia inulinivorans]